MPKRSQSPKECSFGYFMDYTSVLRAICPLGKPTIIAGFASAMPKCIEIANLTTNLRLAHFIAQCAHESATLQTTTEFASGKEYEGRKDLGNVDPGDGPRYKGRGLIQLTGRNNYGIYGKDLDVDLTANPAIAAEFPYAALTAALYWKTENLNMWADRDDVITVTRRVNGGLNGLADREAFLAKAKATLARGPVSADPIPTAALPPVPKAPVVMPPVPKAPAVVPVLPPVPKAPVVMPTPKKASAGGFWVALAAVLNRLFA